MSIVEYNIRNKNGGTISLIPINSELASPEFYCTIALQRAIQLEIDLSQADLSQCKIYGINFTEMDLNGVDFSRSRLNRCYFNQCELIDVNFSAASLFRCEFLKTVLDSCNFSKVNFINVTLDNTQIFES